jgi:hypothetical protein
VAQLALFRSHAGVAPWDVASVPKVTSAGPPSMWPGDSVLVGTT